jgi:O-antigen ligase
MWAVQLGTVGVALLLAFLVALVRDASRFRPEIRRAIKTLVVMLGAVCLFNSVLFDALIGDYFCIMLGLLLAMGVYSTPREEAAS